MTIKSYEICFRDFGRFLSELRIASPLNVTANDLREFQIWLSQEEKKRGGRLSTDYMHIHVAVLRGMYRWLQAEARIFSDPGKALVYSKKPKKLRNNVLTAEEVRALIEAPDDSRKGQRDQVVLRLLVLSGLRSLELSGVNVEDVNLQGRELTVREGKGGKDRLTFFDPGTRGVIARYLIQSRPFLVRDREERALIVSNLGRRMDSRRFWETVNLHAKEAGLEKRLNPMALRHSFCTNLLRYGANLKVIAELAGHASLNTTAGYTHVDITELSAVYRAAHPRSGG